MESRLMTGAVLPSSQRRQERASVWGTQWQQQTGVSMAAPKLRCSDDGKGPCTSAVVCRGLGYASINDHLLRFDPRCEVLGV